uniref:Putative splicing factor 3A subunit 1 n=1 Tax=Noccaea caerulescens TaxID=107243 RepID=A0A1J3FV16_NOCCA
MMIGAETAFGNQWTSMANCTKRRLSGRRHSWKYKTYRTHLDKNPHCNIFYLELPPCRSEPPPLKGFSVPQGITLKELGIIKITAQFVARYGTGHFWIAFAQEVIDKPLFSFLKTTDNRHRFYYGLVAAYQRVLKPRLVLHEEEGTFIDDFYHCLQMDKLDDGDDDDDDDDEKLDIDIILHAFVGGLDFFTHMDVLDDPQVTIMPPPQPVSAMHPLRCREPRVADDAGPNLDFSVKLTLKELGIMKLTAQFVARYGLCFRLALMMRELRNPTFGFMFSPKDQFNSRDPAAARFRIFSKLVVAYSNVLIPSNKFDDSPATLVAAFFLRLQLEKLEQGVAETTLDLHAFVSGSVDYFAHMDDDYYSANMAPPERLSVTMNRPTHSTMLVRFSLGPERFRVSSSTWFILKGAVPPWITPEELAITKLAAQFTERFGTCFERALMSRLSTEPRLDFMRFDEIKGTALRNFGVVYSAVLKPSKKATEGDDDCTAMALDLFFHCLQLEGVVDTTTAVIQLGAFMSGVDYLAYMNKDLDYYDSLPLPQRLSVMMSQVRKPTRIRPILSFPSTCLRQDPTPKELVIMKLTALFAARYGMVFCRDLLKKVALKPEYKALFKFMEPSDTWFKLYGVVVLAYSKVVKEHAYTEETVLENFFNCLEWRRGKWAMLDLYAFVEGVDCFAQMEDDYYSALMGNHLGTQMRCCHPYASSSTVMMQRALTTPGKACRPPLPVPEEPEPKRRKLFDESARVPEDQFVADPGSVIEMTMESLSENVASFKEKMAAVVQVPANKPIGLRGKAGLLKDDKSLADHNAGAQDMLTLSRRSSRWT